MLVLRKGTEFPRITKKAAKFTDLLGHKRVTLRCGSELAIEALPRDIVQVVKREARPFLRDRQWEKASPTGSSCARWDLGCAGALHWRQGPAGCEDTVFAPRT